MECEFGVKVCGLAKRFGEFEALRDVSFDVPAGTITGLLGPNGAGKTTTVRVLSTLIEPDAGAAEVAGWDVATDPAAVRQRLGLTGQFAAVDEQLTGTENLVLFGRLRGLDRIAASARAEELLEMFDLSDAAGQRLSAYSGGMRRRLDLAVSLVVEPSVLVLDEPTTGLDPRSRFALWDIVRALRERGITVLLTTQYLEEADQLADDIVVIDRGTVVAQGTATELKSRIGTTAVEVTLADPTRLAEVVAVMSQAGLTSTTRPEAATVVAPAPDGWASLAAVGSELERAGIEVDDIGLRRPSLDEVFLAITGRDPSAETHADPDSDATASEPA